METPCLLDVNDAVYPRTILVVVIVNLNKRFGGHRVRDIGNARSAFHKHRLASFANPSSAQVSVGEAKS